MNERLTDDQSAQEREDYFASVIAAGHEQYLRSLIASEASTPGEKRDAERFLEIFLAEQGRSGEGLDATQILHVPDDAV